MPLSQHVFFFVYILAVFILSIHVFLFYVICLCEAVLTVFVLELLLYYSHKLAVYSWMHHGNETAL